MPFLLTALRFSSALLMITRVVVPVKADFDYDLDGPYDYYTSSAPRPLYRQFDSWYPNAASHLGPISEGICNQTLRDYRVAYAAPRGSDEAATLLSICYRHEACILDQAGANWTANLASAGVLLGLLPILLSSFGPRVAEIGILFAHRPILTLLMAVGAPLVWPSSRIFEYDDPRDVFSKGPGPKLCIPRQVKWLAGLVCVAEYVLVLCSAGMTLYTTLEMGWNAPLAWRCTTQFGPLLWIVISMLVTLTAAASFRLSAAAAGYTKTHVIASRLRRVWAFMSNRELNICANHDKSSIAALKPEADTTSTGAASKGNYYGDQIQLQAHDPRVAVLLNVVAGCGGFVALVYATVVLGSLQFVTFPDVCKYIVWRLVASTAVCRIVMIVELAGLRSP